MPTVIFDFDGTIADSLPAVVKVFEDLTKRGSPYTKAEIAAFQHLSMLDLTNALGISRWKVPMLLFRGRRMLHHHLRSIGLHPGMSEAIRTLKQDDYTLHILSSNSRRNIQDYLRWHQLDDCFTSIYGGAGLLGKARKLHKLLREQGITAHETWYVGDETRDVIAARHVGLKPLAVTWGYNSRQALEAKNPEALADTAQQMVQTIDGRS